MTASTFVLKGVVSAIQPSGGLRDRLTIQFDDPKQNLHGVLSAEVTKASGSSLIGVGSALRWKVGASDLSVAHPLIAVLVNRVDHVVPDTGINSTDLTLRLSDVTRSVETIIACRVATSLVGTDLTNPGDSVTLRLQENGDGSAASVIAVDAITQATASATWKGKINAAYVNAGYAATLKVAIYSNAVLIGAKTLINADGTFTYDLSTNGGGHAITAKIFDAGSSYTVQVGTTTTLA